MGLFSKKKRKEEPIDVSGEDDIENSVVLEEQARAESPPRESPNADDDYAEFTSQRTEGLMGPEEETHSFGLNLTAKVLFLVGAALYLAMAVEDFQWVQMMNSSKGRVAASNQAAAADDDFDIEEFLSNLSADDSNTASNVTQASTSKNGEERRNLQGAVVNWYSNHYWDELPPVIQAQAALLGYNQELWDTASPVYTDSMFWGELTSAQQAAATNVFGYEEESWNEYVSRFMSPLEETGAPTSSPAAEVESEGMEAPTEPEDVVATGGDDFYGPPEEEGEEEDGADDFYGVPEEPAETTEETENAPETEATETTETTGTMEETETETTEDIVASEILSNSTAEEVGGGTNSSNATEIFPPRDVPARDGTASMIINTAGGYSGREAHGKKYQIMYCVAAACFILVGILDSKRERLGYHAMMVFAGVFGILSGGLIRDDEFISSICHSLSVHFFLIQALLIIYNRLPVVWDPVVRKFLWVADILFVASTLLNIVLSYLYYNEDDEMNMAMATTAIMAAVLWCHTGIIYLAVTIMFLRKKQKSSKEANFEEGSVQNSCSVVPNGEGEMDIVYDGPNQGSF